LRILSNIFFAAAGCITSMGEGDASPAARRPYNRR